MNKQISNGDAWCVIILAAEKIGYKSSCKDMAEQKLYHGRKIEACQIGVLNQEMSRLHNLIAEKGIEEVKKANAEAEKIMCELSKWVDYERQGI